MHRRLRQFLHRLGGQRTTPVAGQLVAIYIASTAGARMRPVMSVAAEANRGLQGDRYHEGAGFWKRTDACQVTLIAAEDLSEIEARRGLRVANGEHRRNLVVRNLPLSLLTDKRLRIGEALFAYHKPRPPCAYLESLTEPGMVKALSRRGGVCLRVLQGGRLRVGDTVSVL